MENRNRNTALALIAAGAYLLLGKLIGFFTVSSLIMIALGLYRLRRSRDKTGFLVLIIGGIVLLNSEWAIILALLLVSLGWFFIKSRREQRNGEAIRRQSLLESLKHDRDPWVFRSMSLWSLIGEIRLDVSLALLEQEETVVLLQGVVGDVDVFMPEEVDLVVESMVTFGQIHVADEKDAGAFNRVYWQSPHAGQGRRRVKLIASYLVGDINVKII